MTDPDNLSEFEKMYYRNKGSKISAKKKFDKYEIKEQEVRLETIEKLDNKLNSVNLKISILDRQEVEFELKTLKEESERYQKGEPVKIEDSIHKTGLRFSKLILNKTVGRRGTAEFTHNTSSFYDEFGEPKKEDKSDNNLFGLENVVDKEIDEFFIKNPRESDYACKIKMSMYGNIVVGHNGEHFYQESQNILGQRHLELVTGDDKKRINKYFKEQEAKYLRMEEHKISFFNNYENNQKFDNIISKFAKSNEFTARIVLEEDDKQEVYFLTTKGRVCNFKKQSAKRKVIKKIVSILDGLRDKKAYEGLEHSSTISLDMYDGGKIEDLYKQCKKYAA